jgi:hypothetical protein
MSVQGSFQLIRQKPRLFAAKEIHVDEWLEIMLPAPSNSTADLPTPAQSVTEIIDRMDSDHNHYITQHEWLIYYIYPIMTQFRHPFDDQFCQQVIVKLKQSCDAVSHETMKYVQRIEHRCLMGLSEFTAYQVEICIMSTNVSCSETVSICA